MEESLKSVDFAKAVSEGLTGRSGTLYVYEPELSASRYYKFQQYIVEMQAGQDAASIVAKMKKALDSLNNAGGPKIADAVININDCLRGMDDLSYQSRKCIMACALLFNRKTDSYETRVRFDEKDLMDKVEDLEATYTIKSFFELLPSITRGLRQN